MDIGLVEGMSSPGKISLRSCEYISTAGRNKKTGMIECVIKRQSRFSRFMCRHQYFPGSRYLRMYLRFLALISWKQWAVVAAAIIIIDSILIAIVLNNGEDPIAAKNKLDGIASVIDLPLLVYILAYMKWKASWHGAMNMAMAAYERGGKTDSASIAAESPVYPKAFDRFYIPFGVGGAFALTLAAVLGLDQMLFSAVFIEAMLWVDFKIGFGTMPGTKQASCFFQRLISVKSPEGEQLLVAQRAMQELVEAHQGKLREVR